MSIYDTISAGLAFQNPVEQPLYLAQTALGAIHNTGGLTVDFRDNLLGIGPNPGSYTWSVSEVDALESALSGAEDVLGNMLDTTNKLSGKVELTGGAADSFRTVVNTATALNKLRGGSDCEQLNAIFDVVTGGVGYVNDFLQTIENIMTTLPATVIGAVIDQLNIITSAITDSVNEIAGMIKEVLDRALAINIPSLFDDPCVKVIIDAVGTPDLINQLI